ncbi:MAG: hypothetical protein MO847_09335 [Candidatus Protistobacter heckmanni]|nr:hypothetical protein [Candidatus Protistobacter heckmanni]
MANREFLKLLKQARDGEQQARLALGKLYLSGGHGMSANHSSALLWLSKAGSDCEEAQMLIGRHVPVRVARQYPDPAFALRCYRQAGLAGSDTARWRYMHWAAEAPALAQEEYADARTLAFEWLQELAATGMAAAHWLLVRVYQDGSITEAGPELALHHARIAAQEGDGEAARWLAFRAVEGASGEDACERIAPLLPDLLRKTRLDVGDAQLMLEYFQRVTQAEDIDDKAHALALASLRHAASAGLPEAQFRLALWMACMDAQGNRLPCAAGTRNASFKKAARWLRAAAAQGVAEAWHVLSVLFRRPQFSGYDIVESDVCLQKAAELGHAGAQYQLGRTLWRLRRLQPELDEQASYWLWRARQQGQPEADELLARITASARPAEGNRWRGLAERAGGAGQTEDMALLAHRIEVVNQFDLDKAEMLLLDFHAARREHCLVIDVRQWLPRTRRRLVLIDKAVQRKALVQAIRAFSESPAAAAEGNYQQRRYRLEKMLSATGLSEEEALGVPALAASA